MSERPFASLDPAAEWLEADGLGGFSSGTVDGIRTRRYHALLLAAVTPPTGRLVLVNGCEVWLEHERGPIALSSQRYAPGVTHPDGATRIASFDHQPWPTWIYRVGPSATIRHELFVRRDAPLVVMTWRADGLRGPSRLMVRPLMSGRDPHSLHHENPAFRFDAEAKGARVTWRPYQGVPAVHALSNGAYAHVPDWYRNFLYIEERDRGLDHIEDLAAPGTFDFDLGRGEAVLILAADVDEARALVEGAEAGELARRLAAAERGRRRFPTALHRAADAYVVRRGEGKTIVAGYPWFTDWGRDTFIAMRGICIAGKRLDDARSMLLEWAEAVDQGMLPNRFVESGDAPEFNSVDASLWYVIAVHDYLAAAPRTPRAVRDRLIAAVRAILAGYRAGTRFGIRMDRDGLLACGEPGWQLTWMDAKVGDWVVTPRIGKPVEIEALWLNALRIGATFDAKWQADFECGLAALHERFWNEDAQCLFDVVDVNHEPGTADASVRPNQTFAVGGLPIALLEGERARRIVDCVERQLMTPLGPRSLAPSHPDYKPRYQGGVLERDGSYHQGTVWPWLAGAFVEAWVRVRGDTDAARSEARLRFLEPLLAHLDMAGLGHVSEIADAEPPHTPRGCPFQAWSVGELLRLDQVVLAEHATQGRRGKSSGRSEAVTPATATTP